MTSNIFSRFGKSYGEVQTFNSNVKNSDYFTSEFEINDAPVGARNLLTKGLIQDEINHYSGAAITTRGRFISKNDHQKNPQDRPLFLYIQGPTKQSIELAIQKIHEIIRNDIGNPIRQGMSLLGNGNGNRQVVATQQQQQVVPTLKPPPLMGVSTNVTQVEKLYIGLDGVPASFDLRGKIIGPSGSNLHYIRSETGAAVTLRGLGSQFIEAGLGREGPEPLHLYLEHPRPEGLATARQLAVNLVETLMQELQQTEFPQQPQMTPPQMSLSMPPPPQHHIVAPPQFSVEHPWLINTQNNQSGQIGGANSQQQFQLQQVVLQPPPRPVTHVNIPPPGVHIPQHAGPLVPPPQLVQLSAPPPSAPPVLVVSHPPPQPLYLPPDMVASSSIGTFSLVQGGLVYHQAPPVQTQAQIGDGNNSMNPLSQPPPQMIITQLQLDHNNQMSHSFQSNQKYHVIGHVQGQMNRDGNSQHQQQIIRQNQNDIYSPFTQSNNANTSNMNSSYQSMDLSDGDSDHDGPSQRRQSNNNPNMQQSEQDNEKQGSRQDNQRGQINLSIPPNQNQNQSGSLSNHFQVTHNRSFPILGQLPPNRPPQPQHLSEGPSSNQSTNNQYLCQQGNNPSPQISHNSNQPANHMSSSQEDSQMANNQQQTRQMPPNQFSDNNSHQQIDQVYNQQVGQQNQGNHQAPNQRIFNQSASNQNEPLSPKHDSKRNDTQGRNRSSRNRRGPRNNRQYVYPWSRSEQDNSNQQSDPVWLRKESIREFENERKMSDFPRNEGRPSRFEPLEDEEVHPQAEDNRQSTQYKNNQDQDHNQQEVGARFNTCISVPSSNQIVQHKTTAQQYGQSDNNQSMQANRNRSDSDHHRKERSPDGGRKRRFEQENSWVNKQAPKSSASADVGKSSHKKRFEQEDYKAAIAGSQRSSKSPSRLIKTADSVKSDKSGSSSKWSDKKGESSKKTEKPDRTESKKDELEGKEKLSPKKMDGPHDKDNETSPQSAIAATKKPAPWSTEQQRTEYKSNAVQYTNTNANQFEEQPVSDNAGNRQYQQNYQPYLNAGQMFQGNLPYHLLPPPPPPPGQSHNNMQMQPGMQFNLPQGCNVSNANTPPNMLMGNNNMAHGFGQNLLGQQGMSNITQNMPPNMNPNVNQNTQYDMAQNMMNNMGHPMAPNNYILPPNMPPGMNQNSPLNIGQNIHQNMSPNMGQMMPNQLQGMPQNMGQNIPHNMGQHMMPNMGQSPSSYMGHNAPNSLQHNMGQNAPNSMQHNMGQNAINQNVGQNQNQMQPNMNQNMGQGMPSMMGNNSPNVNPNMAMNSNNNQSMGINMQSMGQMPHNMVPSMVPPPSNILHGNSGPPPMMPPNMLNRTHMVPPPPPPNIHNITSQPPYPYWVN